MDSVHILDQTTAGAWIIILKHHAHTVGCIVPVDEAEADGDVRAAPHRDRILGPAAQEIVRAIEGLER